MKEIEMQTVKKTEINELNCFQKVTQKNGIEYKKDLAMKLWEMIENMLSEISELFNLGINKKILIMLKSIITYM